MALVCLMLLLALSLSSAAPTENWQRFPSLDTFASYEDMQRYFDQRNLRSMRHIDNPMDDSYLAAFNQYNEQPASPALLAHSRPKREERQLPTAPRMLRFELSDAVEPSQEVKELVRQHRDRSLKAPTKPPTPPSSTTKPPASNAANHKKSRKPRRSRRSAGHRQPANFKVQMIPFEASDAREPDTITAQLISRGRALDVQRQPAAAAAEKPAEKPAAKTQRKQVRKPKRSKRSAPLQVLKFELSDAKTSLPAALQRSGKQLSGLLTMETQAMPANQSQVQMPSTQQTRVDDNLVMSGEAAAESKRMYIYKEAPVSHLKAKKSLSALPHEVQKVISHLIKDGNGGKAYIKYLTPQKIDYEHYKAKTVSYVPKPAAYIKYVAAKQAEPQVSQVPQVQVHIQPVPVVEQLRYVYKPSYAAPSIAQPIVVQEQAPVEQVHHTYSAEVPQPAAEAQLQHVTTSVAEPQFRPSKPDPLQVESSPIYGRPIEQYNYEVQAEPSHATSPLIKIEYLVPADSVKEHYKQSAEFRELSTLIGKSPDDQIHGLTYLLAKEMQAKLQRQPKQLLAPDPRPQDSTAPILFHPGQAQQQQQAVPAPALPVAEHGSLGVQPGRLIGMAKTKQYVPIVEPGNNDVKQLPLVSSTAASKVHTASSFIDFHPGHGHGLSHGYEGIRDEQPVTTIAHIVHHPQAGLATSLPAQPEAEQMANGVHYVHHQDDKELNQYASKYAFGYRIRDFHTGNDFGHKQNRDLHGVTRGQYHILLPDGRVQNVIYHADDTGFHADVSFESGTAKH
ncbi:uncharacterized protein LOC6580479 [Drosophila mojavensis]|uniref:Uncharacterized protein n=1 Tax=Drosophila mojavensis TaxID=7230 RepID=B4KPX5_DROMO|nr:uncharacterized protein LOC6580479 [Drosophila mojavensis]EDW10252.2 uncharacterized protein Dmoj_GI18633 [Drosophila mojavensis]